MSKNTKIISELPETWYVIVTEDIFSDAFRWRFDKEYDKEKSDYVLRNFKPGCIVGMREWHRHGTSKEWRYEKDKPIDEGWGQEISAEDFRFHVLKKYNRQDWIEGRIAILRPQDNPDLLLNSFMKECHSYNHSVIPVFNELQYLISKDVRRGFWGSVGNTKLPVVKDVKELYVNENIMKNSKKIEYRVKEKFQKVSRTLYDTFEKDSYGGYGTFDYKSVLREQYENAGVLDIWFDAVECTPKLPEIKGYKGKDVGDFIHYGCASLSKDWFTSSCNRNIRELTLSSGVKISADQMTQIREYLQK